MAFEKLLADVGIIIDLPNVPGSEGITPDELKRAFDKPGEIIKEYINNVLYPEVKKIVDGDFNVGDSLDATLTSEGKPAQAKAAGDAVRKLFTGAIHGGDYVLASGDCFACTQSGIRTIHIASGKAVISGNLMAASSGDVELSPGTSGMKRNDLVVLRVQRGSNGIVTQSFAAVTGSETAGTPVDPIISSGDINSGAKTIRDIPLYRVSFEGTTFKVDAMFHPETSVSLLQFRNVTIPISAFQEYTGYEDMGVGFRASVPLAGVSADMYPDVTFSVRDALGGAMVCVTESYDGGIYVYSAQKPEGNILVPLITVRKDVQT